MRFCVQYKHVVQQIEDNLRHAEGRYSAFLTAGDPTTWQNFAEAAASLSERIKRACEVISDAQDEIDVWSGWHPPGDWWKRFPKSSAWCRSQMDKWLTQENAQRKGDRSDIRFRLSFLKELDIEPPS